jgi:hypothetical protein
MISRKRLHYIKVLAVMSVLYEYPVEDLIDLCHDRKIRYPPPLPLRDPEETQEEWLDRVGRDLEEYGYEIFKAYRQKIGVGKGGDRLDQPCE